MLPLSAFADEISPDLDEQLRVCQQHGVTHVELRSIGGVNVLAFSPEQSRAYKAKFNAAGVGVVAIASPCGKKPVDTPRAELLDMFKRAVEQAHFFGAPHVRVFSFYPEGGEGRGEIDPIRERVFDLLRAQVELLDGTDVVMLHENEKGIYGDTGLRCADLLGNVNSPKLRAAFDFANFVQVGEEPARCWPLLREWVTHFHVKDARRDGTVVPAGEGDGHVGPILADATQSGYRGFLSLEPHLKVAGHSGGETGPELFGVAVSALRRECAEHRVPLA